MKTTRFNTLSLIEKYELDDLNHLENQVVAADEEFKGPISSRQLTDIKWLILLVLLVIWFLSSCAYVFNWGSLNRLKYSSDFRAEVCGGNRL